MSKMEYRLHYVNENVFSKKREIGNYDESTLILGGNCFHYDDNGCKNKKGKISHFLFTSHHGN